MSDREKLLAELEKSYDIFCPHETQKRFCLPMDLKEALIAALSEPEWRPIAEAPRDGGPILISNGKWISKAYWSESCQFERFEEKAGWQIYQCEDGFYSVGAEPEEPTHWMPLPSPPKGKTP